MVVHEYVKIATEGFCPFSSIHVTKRVHKMPPEKTMTLKIGYYNYYKIFNSFKNSIKKDF